jgi:aspartate racemase
MGGHFIRIAVKTQAMPRTAYYTSAINSEGTTAMPIAGVLGGLGPAATVDFMARVLAHSDADNDQDHIRMLVDHNPTVPDRHRAIAGDTPSVAPQLVDMARTLEAAGADFLVMVCNTAHAYTREIREAVAIPFVSIIEVTVEAVEHAASAVGVMAAEGCLSAGLYQEALEAAGHNAVIWDEAEASRFMELIYRIKAGERDPGMADDMSRLAASLAFAGAESLIAGCTEIPLVLDETSAGLPLLSSTDLLVQRTVALARGDTVLPPR